MTTQTAAIPSVSYRVSGSITVRVAFRPTDPIGLTDIEIEGRADLSADAYLELLTEAIARLDVHSSDYRAALLYDREGLVGYRLNGWPCCAACFLARYTLDAHGVASPRVRDEVIQDVHPIYDTRITCDRCGEARPWIPRVIEGGQKE